MSTDLRENIVEEDEQTDLKENIFEEDQNTNIIIIILIINFNFITNIKRTVEI